MEPVRRDFRFHCFQQIGAVDGQLRRAVGFFRGVAHRQAGCFFAGIPCAADPERGPCGGFAQHLADAQPIDRVDGIGRQVDVGPDAQEL